MKLLEDVLRDVLHPGLETLSMARSHSPSIKLQRIRRKRPGGGAGVLGARRRADEMSNDAYLYQYRVDSSNKLTVKEWSRSPQRHAREAIARSLPVPHRQLWPLAEAWPCFGNRRVPKLLNDGSLRRYVAIDPDIQPPAMPIRITNLALPVERAAEELPKAIADRLGCRPEEIARWRILRQSLDARQARSLRYVFSIEAQVSNEDERLPNLLSRTGVDAHTPSLFADPPPGENPMPERPVVVGSGPAGLLAGYYLSAKGYRPLILERGAAVKNRVPAIRSFDRGGAHDPENNYLFGEGGAGAFSDGKLTCRMSGPDVDWVLERIVDCGGRESIVYENRPHLGSNKLPMICRNFRRRIEALGGEYRFGCRLEGLDVRDGRVVGVETSGGRIATNHVVLAIGHSARDTYEALHAAGLPMVGKAFQLGLRIEQPQENVNRHEYGRPEYLDLLGAASYSLVAKGQRDLFTFCMCAGGWIIPSVSEPGMFCTNGMSNSRHETEFANSGLVVTLDPKDFGSDHPLAGVEVQRKYERLAFEVAGRNYLCPIQSAADFLAERTPDPAGRLSCSYERGAKPLALGQFLPPPIAKAIRAGLPVMDRKWKGEFLKDAMLVGPEMRGSSPVRIDRDRDSRECPGFAGLYPVGEGAGYAGGIISAAVDGLRSARAIVERFAPVG